MCNYCEYPNDYIFDNRDKFSRKGDFFPGIHSYINADDKTMYVGACADVYEPNWTEADIPIRFCPMCGEEL